MTDRHYGTHTGLNLGYGQSRRKMKAKETGGREERREGEREEGQAGQKALS